MLVEYKSSTDRMSKIALELSVDDLYSSKFIDIIGALSYLFNFDTWSVCNGSSGEKDQVIPPTIAAYASLHNDFPLMLVEIGRQSNEQEDNCCSTFEVGVQSIATAIQTDEG